MEYKKKSGFTMIEMIIVIGLIAGLMAMIMPRILRMVGKAKERTTQTILSQIKEGITLFAQDVGRSPRGQEGLKVLYENVAKDPKWRGPYVTVENEDGVPLDGWKQPIVYNLPPKLTKKFKVYELVSFGGEGKDETNSEEREWIVDGE